VASSVSFADINWGQLRENVMFVCFVVSREYLNLVVRNQFFKRHLKQSAGLITFGK
jgi:hypothetical protein